MEKLQVQMFGQMIQDLWDEHFARVLHETGANEATFIIPTKSETGRKMVVGITASQEGTLFNPFLKITIRSNE